MNATTVSPLAQLKAAESSVIAQLEAATAVVQQTATGSIDGALNRLRVEVDACRERIRCAVAEASALMTDLAESIGDMARGDVLGLTEEPASEPVPDLPPAIAQRINPDLPPAHPEPTAPQTNTMPQNRTSTPSVGESGEAGQRTAETPVAILDASGSDLEVSHATEPGHAGNGRAKTARKRK